MLWQRWIWLSQIQCCYNVATTLKMNAISHHCGNVASMLVYHCSNVATMLENYVMLWCCHNIATTLKMMLYHNVHTVFRQHCVNVVWTLVPNVESWPNYNIQATLSQHCGIVKNYVIFNIATTLSQCCLNIVWALWANQSTSIHTMLNQHWEITLFSTSSQHCYNIGGTHQESKI